MQRLKAWFDFKGRTSRLDYWRRNLEFTALVCVSMLIGLFAMTTVGRVAAVLLIPIPIFVFAMVATAVRRLHDRDKSAWWMAVFYGVPFVVGAATEDWHPRTVGPALLLLVLGLGSLACSLWGLVEVGFLRGTRGPNRFGYDPLAPVLEEISA